MAKKQTKQKREGESVRKLFPVKFDAADRKLVNDVVQIFGLTSGADAIRFALRFTALHPDIGDAVYWNEFYETGNPDAKQIAFKGNATCVACGRELLPDGSCPNDDPSANAEADIASIEVK